MRYGVAAPSARDPRRLMRLGRVCVFVYWGASLAFGGLRLAQAGFSGPALTAVLYSWYLEALVFLALWGGAACVIGLTAPSARRLGRAPSARRVLDASTLGALTRDRVR